MSFDIEAILGAGIEKHAVELDRIRTLDDPNEQGYAIAPIILDMADCTAWELLDAMLVNYATPDDPDDVQRDNGIIRWCNEQLEKQQ